MVNTDSELYKKHPDWALEIPGRVQAEGRNQRLLDLAKPEVRDYLFAEMSRVFTEGAVDYVKWDYNRNFSDYAAFCDEKEPHKIEGLPETTSKSHACILGLYDLMGRLVKKFPDILFEGCASGGNRFTLEYCRSSRRSGQATIPTRSRERTSRMVIPTVTRSHATRVMFQPLRTTRPCVPQALKRALMLRHLRLWGMS